jgi:hypothetical protein
MGMKAHSCAMLGTLLSLWAQAAPALEISSQTWVASNGTNNGNCDFVTPCDTFQHAYAATFAGGTIGCIDAGSYGRIIIGKAISVICDDSKGGILTNGGNIGVDVQAGPSDTVTLKGLDIEGAGTGLTGIYFQSGAALHVSNVHVRNVSANLIGASGIYFKPNSYAELYVSDSIITDSGNSSQSLSAGILIAPQSSASVNAFLSRDKLENNSIGINVNGSLSTGVAVNATVSNCVVVGGAGNGIQAVSSAGHAATSVLVDHSVSSGNFASGINANGVAASGPGSSIARVGDATIVLNVTGISQTGSGVVQSFKNNRIAGNLSDGTPVTAYPGPGSTPLQ